MRPTQSDQAVRRPQGLRRFFYQIYIACLLGLNGVIFLPNDGASSGEGSLLFSATWAALHVGSIGLLLTMRERPKGFPLALLFGAYATLSCVWSVTPVSSALYGGMLTGNILVAYVLANETSPRELLRLLGEVITALSLAGILAYYANYPQVTWFDTRGRTNAFGGEFLRGFFPHRIAGALYVLIGAVAVFVTKRGTQRAFALVIFAWFSLLAASATGYVLLLIACLAYFAATVAAKRRVTANGFVLSRAIIGLLVAPIVWLCWGQLLEALGRDATLTGRTLLWSWGASAWSERPVLGWGYTAYFESADAAQSQARIGELRFYDVPHFHQAYIQTAVDLGMVGLLAFLALIGRTAIDSYRYAVRSRTSDAEPGGTTEGAAFFSLTATLAVAGLAIYTFPVYNHFGTFTVFALLFSMRSALPRHTTPRMYSSTAVPLGGLSTRNRRPSVPNLRVIDRVD